MPLDGSRLAESVLDPAVRLARAARGSVTLLHAVTPAESFAMPAREVVARERKRAARYLSRLAERLGGPEFGVVERVVTGEASRAIVLTADKEKADLIAMSTHGRSGVREWVFGSVTERVLRSTVLPVLIFRGNPAGGFAIRRILLPLDGSEAAMASLDPAAELAAGLGAELLVLHVGKRLPDTVERAVRSLTRRGLPVHLLLRNGDPKRRILATAETEAADLIALTPTGRSQRERVFFGSVAEGVLKETGRPLLMVRGR